ncbi:hypothetical protein ACE41H_21515 [Paenibacillus enshidis]|uniref:HTH cro/C1-type domain-containing protein n=1 Tax=Paenibacillus enshidis TaxID=1458439 RepID=A0ABV5AYP5_9BACL
MELKYQKERRRKALMDLRRHAGKTQKEVAFMLELTLKEYREVEALNRTLNERRIEILAEYIEVPKEKIIALLTPMVNRKMAHRTELESD